MARVGFCINGFAGDNRDYFPFHFVDDPAGDTYRTCNLTFDKAFEYIHRIRGLRLTMNLSVLDDTVDPPAETSFNFSQTADRIYKGGDELAIQRSFTQNYDWPDWQYSLPVYDEFYGSGAILLGSAGDVPLVYVSEDAFSPWLFVAASIEGGDPGDRSVIAQISTIQEAGWRQSQVQGFYRDEPFIVYEPGASGDRYVTGYIRIEGASWFGYNGIWSQSTGAQLISPVPSGF